MWHARREHVWGGAIYMGRKYQVSATDGLLTPQPGGEDMADILRMRSLPTHYVFRVAPDSDPAEAELAGPAAEPEAPAAHAAPVAVATEEKKPKGKPGPKPKNKETP